MNIQIFGTKKCRDTQKAERWFKERNIQFQFINLKEKEMSLGEFNSVLTAVGGVENLINKSSKDFSKIAYLMDEDIVNKVFENQLTLLLTPIVRNGRKATCGMQPDVWKNWE
ncbi:MAG: ArsC family transcriptional regulator [Treponema sp. CETP13]|nr:MAG: ArsC family transcriptional regulator [Treponema sp. CETP13]